MMSATCWEAIRNDSEQAYNELFAAYWQPSFTAAYRLLRDRDAAEDVVQEVFAALWTRRKTLLVHNPEAFIRQMVKNQVFTVLSRRKLSENNVQVLENCLFDHSPEESYMQQETLAELESAVAALPAKCREVFVLRRFEGLNASSIAEQLNISIRTVENHLYHALNLLKKQLYVITVLLFIKDLF